MALQAAGGKGPGLGRGVTTLTSAWAVGESHPGYTRSFSQTQRFFFQKTSYRHVLKDIPTLTYTGNHHTFLRDSRARQR